MDYLIDVLHGIWIAWSSPEFGPLRWGLIGFAVGAVLSWFAAREWHGPLDTDQDPTAKDDE